MSRRLRHVLTAPALAAPLAASLLGSPAAAATPAASPAAAPAGTPTSAPASVTPGASLATTHIGTVKELQQRLKYAGVYTGLVSGTMDTSTRTAVKRFQGKFGLVPDGIAGTLTWAKLRELTANGYAIDSRCKTTGKVICIDKTLKILRALYAGKIVRQNDARFGRPTMPTREGSFKVYWKDRDHVSSIYDASMPFSLFFSGGQAVHYSSDFARVGYAGSSHGCVNLRSWSGAEALYDWAPVGTKVVIYRS